MKSSLYKMMSRSLLLLAALGLLSACGASDPESGQESEGESDSAGSDNPASGALVVGMSWHWQLQASLNTGYGVDIYDVDLFDTDTSVIGDLQAQGRLVICYFSAGSWEDWRDDAGDFEQAALGNPLDGWPGEKWLDVRASSLQAVMEARLDLAVDKGCDGVEPDNVDGYANDSGFSLSGSDQLAYNRFLASAAHERGLLIGLKNDLDQISELVTSFDFAVNEECYEYDECERLTPFIDAGKPVLHAEYADGLVNDSEARALFCDEMLALGLSSMVLPLELDDSFRFACD
ncbi:MAG: endo alpha-1,4 polygalactosaminidase [Thalassolituus sp.]|jgi:hypothetical protein|uniref:endo alpha-1,4 polygalactosaminidase n=1 Tax=Thalassolituus sp. TaxID=2030822 RepID=UPI0027D54A9D|nr:endo alpha-1,4 polygalactosaminidase [Thalassolituus sp.]MDQ4423029.1 endo alpha-1,4 polygalactosaminidase [Thalassolituus sp.]MDQ4424880.1 endo alpha-1,4 polygalactosaminidase [Thalassolituus sp.]